jgi:hypothetical protein
MCLHSQYVFTAVGLVTRTTLYYYYLLFYLMEQSRFSETSSRSAAQETLRLLWGPNFHYPVHKSLSLVPCEFIPQNPSLFLEDMF